MIWKPQSIFRQGSWLSVFSGVNETTRLHRAAPLKASFISPAVLHQTRSKQPGLLRGCHCEGVRWLGVLPNFEASGLCRVGVGFRLPCCPVRHRQQPLPEVDSNAAVLPTSGAERQATTNLCSLQCSSVPQCRLTRMPSHSTRTSTGVVHILWGTLGVMYNHTSQVMALKLAPFRLHGFRCLAFGTAVPCHSVRVGR